MTAETGLHHDFVLGYEDHFLRAKELRTCNQGRAA
jgi:hypothetical protein